MARINAALGEVLRLPELAARLEAPGIEPVDAPPEALGARIRADQARWVPVVRRTRMGLG